MVLVPTARFANEIDLSDVRACPACLLELAWKIRNGERPSSGLVLRTCNWIWHESEADFRRAVVRARMQEAPGAEEALRDFELNGWRGRLFQALVCRIAAELAEEMQRDGL
jgi:hypothetical protein